MTAIPTMTRILKDIESLTKLLLIKSSGLTETDLKNYLDTNKNINMGREFLKSL